LLEKLALASDRLRRAQRLPQWHGESARRQHRVEIRCGRGVESRWCVKIRAGCAARRSIGMRFGRPAAACVSCRANWLLPFSSATSLQEQLKPRVNSCGSVMLGLGGNNRGVVRRFARHHGLQFVLLHGDNSRHEPLQQPVTRSTSPSNQSQYRKHVRR